jgi:P2 family phage contractile tail tube protein
MFPRILKNFNAFVNGRGFQGRIDEIELPELALKMEEIRMGGMDGSYEVDMGMETLTSKLTIKDPDAGLYRLFGVANTRVQFRGHFVRDQTNESVNVVVTLGGKMKKLGQGSWKSGDPNSTECEFTHDFYSLSIGGEEVHYVDIPNMIRRIGGIDQLADARAGIGI